MLMGIYFRFDIKKSLSLYDIKIYAHRVRNNNQYRTTTPYTSIQKLSQCTLDNRKVKLFASETDDMVEFLSVSRKHFSILLEFVFYFFGSFSQFHMNFLLFTSIFSAKVNNWINTLR